MKIFITGWNRSGTTLMKNIVENHPDVKIVFHETGLLKLTRKQLMRSKTLQNKRIVKMNSPRGRGVRSEKVKIDFDMNKDNWGEKIPYYTLQIKKGYHDSIYSYINKWNSYFQPDSRIIHMIRHPIDASKSARVRGASKRIGTAYHHYQNTVPSMIHFLNDNITNFINIKYEDLLINPKGVLSRVFDFCELDNGNKVIEKILQSNYSRFGYLNKDRAFAFLKAKPQIKAINPKKIYPLLNKIRGPKYRGY